MKQPRTAHGGRRPPCPQPWPEQVFMQIAEQIPTLHDTACATAETAARQLAAGAECLTTEAGTLQSGGWEEQADRAPVGQLPPPAATGTARWTCRGPQD